MPSTGTRVNLNVNTQCSIEQCCAHDLAHSRGGRLALPVPLGVGGARETALGGRRTAFGICNP